MFDRCQSKVSPTQTIVFGWVLLIILSFPIRPAFAEEEKKENNAPAGWGALKTNEPAPVKTDEPAAGDEKKDAEKPADSGDEPEKKKPKLLRIRTDKDEKDKKEEEKKDAKGKKKGERKKLSAVTKKLLEGEIISLDFPIEGSGVKGSKAVALISSHPAIVWEVLIDYQNLEDYWPDVITSMLIDKVALGETIKQKLNSIDEIENYFDVFVTSPLLDWDNISGMYSSYQYVTFEIPTLPLKWAIVKVDHNEKLFEKGIFSVRWQMVLGDLKTYKGVINLEPFGKDNSKTRMTYSRVIAPADENIPASLTYYYPETYTPLFINRLRERCKNMEARYLKRIEEKGRINYVQLGEIAGEEEKKEEAK